MPEKERLRCPPLGLEIKEKTISPSNTSLATQKHLKWPKNNTKTASSALKSSPITRLHPQKPSHSPHYQPHNHLQRGALGGGGVPGRARKGEGRGTRARKEDKSSSARAILKSFRALNPKIKATATTTNFLFPPLPARNQEKSSIIRQFYSTLRSNEGIFRHLPLNNHFRYSNFRISAW